MKLDRLAVALVFVAGASVLVAQRPVPPSKAVPAASTERLVVDVHAAPHRRGIVYRTSVSPQRFEMRNATVFDMIEFAYDLGEQDDDRENAAIVGGPPWVDFDRFDVVAKVPAVATAAGVRPEAAVRALMQRVLAERFRLKFHNEDRPLPGYVVSVAKDGPRLAEAKATDLAGSCVYAQDVSAKEKANAALYTVACTAETVGAFVATLDQDFPHTIVDRTGLTKAYDFTLRLTLGPDVHTRDDRARVYTEAMGRQLGLVVTRGDVAQPAVVIDAVERTPTANLPDIAKLLPARPDLDFEVATVRPAADSEPQSQVRSTGSQITFSSMPLSELIVRAWQLSTAAVLGDQLARLPKTRFTILVKLPAGVDGRVLAQDPDLLADMLRKLLIERFQIRYHWGEWTQPDAYVLMAGTPKMKKADPASRSFCKYGPAEGERAGRYAGSPYDGEFHCQNVTMAQFADLLETVAGSEVKNRVPDKTGLAGSYDFTVVYTSSHTLRLRIAEAAKEAKQNGDATVAPVDGVSAEDAFRKQLGLKLEKQPLALPALVLDHFAQAPSEN